MRWSTEPYALEDGSEERGLVAAALRSLDAYDPTSLEHSSVYTEESTRRELVNFLDDTYWCHELGCCVTRRANDTYETCDEGYLKNLVLTFMSARVIWARRELGRYPDEGRVKAYMAFAKAGDKGSLGRDRLDAIKQRIRIRASELDTNPHAIGTPLGVALLEDGILVKDKVALMKLAGRPVEDEEPAVPWRVTKHVEAPMDSYTLQRDFDYDDRWDTFVDEICDGDGEKAEFLQRALGYSLYGGNPEKATFVLWSRRRNCGKSTLMEIVKHALGDYADSAPVEMLLKSGRKKDYAAADPVMAGLKGKRLVDMSEPPVGAKLDGARVKQLASGLDKVKPRGLFKENVEFTPEFTMWLHCNSLPIVEDPTAIDPEHMFVIEFTRSFEGKERDFDLPMRFSTERGMSTVLSWLLNGYSKYKDEGLNPPQSVRENTEAWLVTSGTWVDDFIERFCVFGSGLTYPVQDFWDMLEEWRVSIDGERVQKSFVNTILKVQNVGNSTNRQLRKRLYRGMTLDEGALRLALPSPQHEPKGATLMLTGPEDDG